ncbi:MAG: hypothetical protein WB765_15085 [Acidimicrobiales bacterium]
MSERQISRWMGPLGLGVVALLVVGFAVLGGSQPSQNASGPAVVAYNNAHVAQHWAQVYVIGLGLTGLVVFLSHLRVLLQDRGGSGTLANASFAAGILLVGALLVSGIFSVALILAAHNHEPGIARTLNFISQNDELGFLFGMALLALATGAAILRQGWLPKWLGWVGIVAGVVCVAGPISFVGFVASGIWIAILGFVIGARSKVVTGEVSTPLAGVAVGS